MEQLINKYVNHFGEDSLYQREKARTIFGAALIALPTMLLSVLLHVADQKPFHVIFADGMFLAAACLTLYAVRKKRLLLGGNLMIFSLFFLVIVHNLVTDYFTSSVLSYYRILETTLLFALISISIPLFMQQGKQLLIAGILGSSCITLHYFILTSKSNTNPWETHPLSVLIAYVLIFLVISVIAYQIQKVFMRLLKAAEDESDKVRKYNQELEVLVQERTSTLEEQNQELKKVNSELDRFVYSASHDLRAPLTSLLGLIQLTKMEDDPEQIKKFLSLQEKSIYKLDNFIQDIVNVSKNVRTEVRQDEIDFHKLIEGIFDQLDYMDHARQINKKIELQQQSSFFSDQYRMSIILNNLLSNAIRYAVPHRKNAYINVRVEIKQGEALLKIEDNGRGIADEHLEKIFEMFFRTDNDNAGSGLGLYIVKETLDKLGGQITVSSTLGKGTTFTIKIPSEVPCHSLSNA